MSRLSHARRFAGALALALGFAHVAHAAPQEPGPTAPSEMKPYVEAITGAEVKFEMVPIPGGEFVMGSPAEEAKRNEDEGPQHPVKIAPFWMGKYEVTWDEYDQFAFSLDLKKKKRDGVDLAGQPAGEQKADAVTRPTPPYADETFGFGRKGQPVICITHHAAMEYCRWLSAKTGKVYRLPTEAEWEYACRAGTKSPYFFGDDASQIGDYAWYVENAEKPQPIGKKKPNPWGLFDIHGNVAEWCLDHYVADQYKKFPVDKPTLGPRRPARRQGISLRGPRRLVGRRRRPAPQRGPEVVEPRVERSGSPAAPEHLVAHRRHVRRLPDRPAPERAGESQGPEIAGGQGQDDTLSQSDVRRGGSSSRGPPRARDGGHRAAQDRPALDFTPERDPMTDPTGSHRRDFLKVSAAATAGLAFLPSVHAKGNDTIKVGLIGCGGRGTGAAENICEAAGTTYNIKLHALGDVFEDRLRNCRDHLKNNEHCKEKFDVPPSGIDSEVTTEELKQNLDPK